jgi:hypothetical protein
MLSSFAGRLWNLPGSDSVHDVNVGTVHQRRQFFSTQQTHLESGINRPIFLGDVEASRMQNSFCDRVLLASRERKTSQEAEKHISRIRLIANRDPASGGFPITGKSVQIAQNIPLQSGPLSLAKTALKLPNFEAPDVDFDPIPTTEFALASTGLVGSRFN